MKIKIVNRNTGCVLDIKLIHLSYADTKTTDLDYFDEAWRAIVEDGITDDKYRNKYDFEIVL